MIVWRVRRVGKYPKQWDRAMLARSFAKFPMFCALQRWSNVLWKKEYYTHYIQSVCVMLKHAVGVWKVANVLKNTIWKKIAAIPRVFEKHKMYFLTGLSCFIGHLLHTTYSYWCACVGRMDEDEVSCVVCQWEAKNDFSQFRKIASTRACIWS